MSTKERTRGFFGEFKTFIARGNVMDMAVGVIIGGAFKTIVDSLVNDIIMPAVSMLIGGVNFSEWKVTLKQAVVDADGVEQAAAVSLNYGALISAVINFIIMAFAVFCMVKAINTLHEKAKKKDETPEEEPAPPEPTQEELLLAEIRDLLKEKQSHV